MSLTLKFTWNKCKIHDPSPFVSFTICFLLVQLVSDVILLNFRYHYLALHCVPQNRSVITGDPVKLA
jgi:hypothetical protein